MNAKILLIALSAAAFTSCSTAYKSGQTPDDVYYSPVRTIEEKKENDRNKEEAKPAENTADNNRIRMAIRDRRWRDLDNDYDYSYNNSPYHYCNCNCNNYGYYYNPYYYSKPLYYPRVVPTVAINSTPRMVNLNTYKNYSSAIVTDPKTGATSTQASSRRYNNSNNGGSKFGNIIREVFTPSGNNGNNNSSSTNNNTRTYTPATNNNSSSSSSSGSSSGGSSSGTSVPRPGRG
jgi:hypothetical protein